MKSTLVILLVVIATLGATQSVRAEAGLSLTKTVDNTNGNLGETVTYTITVSNGGPSAATGVVAEDGFPAGKLSYISDTPSQGSYDDATGEWLVGTIAAGASATLEIVVQVLVDTNSDPVTNTAAVTAANEPDPDSVPDNSGVSPDEDDTDSVTIHDKAKATDLGIVKVDSQDPIAIDEPLAYTLTVTNHGPDKTDSKKGHEVVAEDRLPTGVVFVSTAGTDPDFVCVYDPVEHEVVCRRTANLEADDPVDIVINVTTPPSAADITNTAFVWVDNTDPGADPAIDNNSANDSDVEVTTVTPPWADLELIKIVDSSYPDVGDDVTFTITVRNRGPEACTGVEVVDLLPAGLTYQGDDPSQGNYDDATGLWAVGTLASGASATLDVVARVDVGTPITNTAEVTAFDGYDTDSTPGNGDPSEDDQDSATLQGPTDLSITKTDSTDPVLPGGSLTYTVAVVNDGPGEATGLIVTDTLPPGVTFVSAQGASWDCNESGGVVTCTRYSLSSGSSSNILITVTAPASSGTITNSASVTSTTPDPDSDNNAATEQTTVSNAADLWLTKTVDNTTADQGDPVTYTLTIGNDGPDDATGVVVKDGFPAGKLSYTSDTPSQGSYDDVTGEWTVGTIGTGGTATLDIVATVLVLTETDPITNVAEVIAANEYDPDSAPDNSGVEPDEDDTDSATVMSTASATDLGIVKSDSVDPVAAGGALAYTLTVTNHGPDKTDSKKKHEVVARDRLPQGTVFVSTTGTDGDFECVYDPVTHDVTCRRTKNLDPDVPVDVVINVTAPSAPGTVCDTADVWVETTDPSKPPAIDNNSSNDVATERTTVTTLSTDLALSKAVDVPEPSEWEDVIFTVTVQNLGPNGATGVEVEDFLPAGLVYLNDTPSQGTYDEPTGTWMAGAIGNGSSATLDIVARVDVGTAGTTITNTASITSLHQTDSNAGNDSDTAAIDVVALPAIRIQKTLETITDPVNGGANPKAIPAATVEYTIEVTNEGDGPTDSDTVVITDAVPAGTELFVGDIDGLGSGPILFTDGATASGLSYTFIDLLSDLDSVDFSDDGGLTYAYVPTPDGDGFDANVTHFRVTPSGAFAGSGGGTDPSFSVTFRTRVQ